MLLNIPNNFRKPAINMYIKLNFRSILHIIKGAKT